ncbi:hypothetical protein [Soonwooa purpurea]
MMRKEKVCNLKKPPVIVQMVFVVQFLILSCSLHAHTTVSDSTSLYIQENTTLYSSQDYEMSEVREHNGIFLTEGTIIVDHTSKLVMKKQASKSRVTKKETKYISKLPKKEKTITKTNKENSVYRNSYPSQTFINAKNIDRFAICSFVYSDKALSRVFLRLILSRNYLETSSFHYNNPLIILDGLRNQLLVRPPPVLYI